METPVVLLFNTIASPYLHTTGLCDMYIRHRQAYHNGGSNKTLIETSILITWNNLGRVRVIL